MVDLTRRQFCMTTMLAAGLLALGAIMMPRRILALSPTGVITMDDHEGLQEGRTAAAIPIDRRALTGIALQTDVLGGVG